MEVFNLLSGFLKLGIGGAILASFLFVFFFLSKKSKKDFEDININIKDIDIKDITSQNSKTIENIAEKYDIELLDKENHAKYLFNNLEIKKIKIKNQQVRFFILSIITFVLFLILLVFGIIYFIRQNTAIDETVNNENELTKNKENDIEYSIPEMVRIIGGNYIIGVSNGKIDSLVKINYAKKEDFSNETPQRNITINDFNISKYEITVKQFNDYLKDCNKEIKKLPNRFNSENQPIINVTWYDANNYCLWLSQKTGENFRLPYEIEWEIAAKGKTQNLYAWGNNKPNDKNCNFKYSYIKSTVSNGKTPTNCSDLGIYNMSGNVSEWCLDWYHSNHYELITKGVIIELPESQEKVIRGGGWKDIAFYIRCTARYFAASNDKSNSIGFRIVRSIN